MRLVSIIVRLEGVLALTGDVYFEAMNEALSEAGFFQRISRDSFAAIFGQDVGREMFLGYATRHLFPRKQTSDLRTLFEVTYKHLRACARDKLVTAKVMPGPGILDLAKAARDAGVRLSVVTGLPLDVADKLLTSAAGADARNLFDCVIRQDLQKPAAAFVEAAAAAPGPSIVLESTTAGLAAAETAGIPAVAVIGSSVLANGMHGARAVVDRLTDLIEEASYDPVGWNLLVALDAILTSEAVEGITTKIIDLQVRDVLRDKGGAVKSVNPTDTVQFLAQRLRSDQIGAMVVIADTGALEGIVSERDIARGVAEFGASILEMPVSSIMSRAVITCAPVDSIHNIAKVMTARRIRHLPVSEGDTLIGLISIGDVLNRRLEEVRYQASVLRRSGEAMANTPDAPRI